MIEKKASKQLGLIKLKESPAKKSPSRAVLKIKVMKIKEIIEEAKKSLVDLTGFKGPRGIGVKKVGKDWLVRIEITEKTSIPDGLDVLGIYDVRLDEGGEILNYERRGLKKRGDIEVNIEEGETK